MKLNLSILTGVTSLAALISGVFADTAVTDPVGYVTINVNNAAGAAPGVSFIGATLVNGVTDAGTVAVAGSGTTVTLPASVGPFGTNSVGQPQYYFEITSGPDAGKWTDCTMLTAGTTLTLADPLGALVTVGTSYKIRKHHTFGSLFGDTEATCVFNVGVDINSADEIQILGGTGVPVSYFFNTDDLGVLGWVNVSSGFSATDETIAPGVGMRVVRRSAVTKPAFVQVGSVKTGVTQIPIEAGLNYVTVPLSTGWSVAGETEFLATGLLGGIDGSFADNLELFTAGVPTLYFNSTDDLDPGLKPGAFSAAEGTAMRIKRIAGPAFNMVFPAQVINTSP